MGKAGRQFVVQRPAFGQITRAVGGAKIAPALKGAARNTFGAVVVLSTGIAIDTGGRSFSAAIAADGTTYTWGDNTSKQLGNTTLSAVGTSTPTAVPSFDAVP